MPICTYDQVNDGYKFDDAIIHRKSVKYSVLLVSGMSFEVLNVIRYIDVILQY